MSNLSKTEQIVLDELSQNGFVVAETHFNTNATTRSALYGMRKLKACRKLVQKGVLRFKQIRHSKWNQFSITQHYFYPV